SSLPPIVPLLFTRKNPKSFHSLRAAGDCMQPRREGQALRTAFTFIHAQPGSVVNSSFGRRQNLKLVGNFRRFSERRRHRAIFILAQFDGVANRLLISYAVFCLKKNTY